MVCRPHRAILCRKKRIMKKKIFALFISKMALSFVSLFVLTATKNAAEPETTIIDVHFGTQLF